MISRLRPTLRNFFTAGPAFSSSAVGALNRSAATLPPGAYDELIDAAGRKRDFVSVRDLLCQRLSNGIYNTRRTFKFIATDLSVLEDLLQVFSEISCWFTRKHAHDALIAQLCRMNRTEDALRVIELMATKNYGVTASTFHPILIGLTKRKQLSIAWRVLDAMREKKVRPDLTSYNYILSAYCSVGNVASAADTLVKMEEEGIVADAMTYDALVLGSCGARNVDAAVAVITRALEDGVQPLISSYTNIIRKMVRRGHFAQAVDFVRTFAGRDEELDAECSRFLLKRLNCARKSPGAKSAAEDFTRSEFLLKRNPVEPIGKTCTASLGCS